MADRHRGVGVRKQGLCQAPRGSRDGLRKPRFYLSFGENSLIIFEQANGDPSVTHEFFGRQADLAKEFGQTWRTQVSKWQQNTSRLPTRLPSFRVLRAAQSDFAVPHRCLIWSVRNPAQYH